MKLRKYQVQLKEITKSLFFKGFMCVILCAPTGSGKTVTFADIALESVKKGSVVMIAVDRTELLEQARSKLIDYGLNPAIIKSGKTMRKNANCYVATVQTLKKRVFPEIDLLIIDEAHKQIFDPVVRIYKEAGVYTIGATATPIRSGKMTQMSDIYDEIVETVTISDLIKEGFLVPAITYSVKMDTSKIRLKGNEYDNKEVFDMFDKRQLYDDVVGKYKKHTPNTKAVCFNVNVEHSKKQTQAFLDAGISSAHLDGTTPKKQREDILKAFKNGFITVLNNVDILTTGYDEWTIETVIVNRVTLSLSLWLQMCGRGSRITPSQLQNVSGFLQKTHFNLLDMGGNVYKLGFWEQERTWSLTHKRGEKEGIAPVIECPEDKYDQRGFQGCGCIIPAPAPSCKFCGYVFPKEEKKLLEGEFIQVENYNLLPLELVGKAWGDLNLEQLEKVREVKGYKQGWIIRQIAMNSKLKLIDYAHFKNYKHPEAWVARMEEMYNLKPIENES
jgi:superfamily II DNA or RNA helicase